MTTFEKFEEIYEGPKFNVFRRYAQVMTLVSVSFTWGTVIPILFPITLAGLCITYVKEYLMLYYCYQKPPVFDEKLSSDTIRVLYVAPVFYCLIGWWALSN